MSRLVAVVWSIGILGISTIPIAAGYAAWWAVLVLVGCVVVPHLLVVLARWLRIPSVWTAVGVGLMAVVAATALAAQPADAEARWTADGVLSPLIDSIPRLLTAPRPAPADIGLLMPAALLVWLSSLAVALAVTAQGRARIAPLIGALVLQVAGALLTAGAGDPYGAVAAASVLLILAGWISTPARHSDRRPARRASRRGWALGLVTAALVGLLTISASALVGGDRFEPRTLVPAPPLPAQAVNPLPDVPRWNAEADTALFTLSTPGAMPERVRLAVLPDFDGASWTLDAGLRPVGVVATPDTPMGEWQTPITFRVEAGAIDSAWVPGVGHTSAVSVDGAAADGLLLDPDTGSLVSADGAVPQALTITASVDAPSDEAIAQAGVPPASEVQRYLALPRVPDELVGHAEVVVDGVSARWDQVTELADFVRGERILDEGAPSGASYGRIAEFLFAPEAEGGQVGTTEQFAASFAVLARAVGLPSRLVVGFGVDPAAAESSADGSRVTVTGSDARVWAEVYLARAGWIAVDAAPDSAIRTEHTPPASSTEATPAPQATPSDGDGASTDGGSAAPVADADEQPNVPMMLAVVGGALVALLIAAVVVLVVRRARRRARWRWQGAPGAWALVLDALALAGRPPAAGAAPEEIVAAAVPADSELQKAALALAAQAQSAAFGPVGDAGADAFGSDAGWATAMEIERSLRRASSPWRRLTWSIVPLSRR
ncbi:transglutaminaseTgpA domain-containing protein [Microbacterium sp. Mu-80]|uniref:TransglutaminaseTgpA domain-containing protein n=1 Tax=Microbacterium bandirmense TaxID=3122050 RepID=A0ABU8LEX9_9MICO